MGNTCVPWLYSRLYGIRCEHVGTRVFLGVKFRRASSFHSQLQRLPQKDRAIYTLFRNQKRKNKNLFLHFPETKQRDITRLVRVATRSEPQKQQKTSRTPAPIAYYWWRRVLSRTSLHHDSHTRHHHHQQQQQRARIINTPTFPATTAAYTSSLICCDCRRRRKSCS
jgi:hypothetical protein